MREFAELYRQLDSTTKTNIRVESMAQAFATMNPADAAWAVWFLSGKRLSRVLSVRALRTACLRISDIPEWLFDASYDLVGDLAETIALLLPAPRAEEPHGLSWWVEQEVLPLRDLDEAGRIEAICKAWSRLPPEQCFLYNKLLTGGLRVGISQRLVVRSLSRICTLPPTALMHRMAGHWEPTAEAFTKLLDPDTTDSDRSRPYPFCLAHPLTNGGSGEAGNTGLTSSPQREPALEFDQEANPAASLSLLTSRLGAPGNWLIEWKWDGIRAQIVRRDGRTWIWSRGEELITERFPELSSAADDLPDGTALDGEILAVGPDGPLPFTDLQKRLNRRRIGPRLLREVPTVFRAFDLMESGAIDVRELPLSDRRRRLEELLTPGRFSARQTGERQLQLPGFEEPPEPRALIELSPTLDGDCWHDIATLRSQSRENRAEGLMLKRRESVYSAGRVRDLWYKWKIDPYTCDAVLLYAKRGHGKRSGLFTDYTFGCWDGEELVPVASAYSGLSNAEIKETDKYIRANTLGSFGPVRKVRPELVFELAFEAVHVSDRHKSGVAVRFPRILRPRPDKPPEEADTLQTLRSLPETSR